MKKLLLLCPLLFSCSYTTYVYNTNEVDALSELRKKAVLIKVYKDKKYKGYGSGTIMKSTSDGSLIQTAYHVVSGELLNKIKIKTSREEFFSPLKIIKYHKKLDIAIIYVKRDLKVNTKLAYVNIKLGQPVFSYGYPYIRGRSSIVPSFLSGHIITKIDGYYRFDFNVYFGMSGSGIFVYQEGEYRLVSIVQFLSGFQGINWVPQPDCSFGINIKKIHLFYRTNK